MNRRVRNQGPHRQHRQHARVSLKACAQIWKPSRPASTGATPCRPKKTLIDTDRTNPIMFAFHTSGTSSRPSPLDVQALYRSHGDIVFHRALRILGTETEAQDVTQEIFIHLWEHPESFRGDSKITTWLYTVTTRRCLNRIRNQKNRQALLTQNVHISNTNSFETTAVGRAWLQGLPADLATVAVYRYGDDMSRADIAQAMTISERQVNKLIKRLEKKIQLLKQEGDAI